MMKPSAQEIEKRLVYNNFLDFFSLTLAAKDQLGCRYALPDAPFPLFNAILHTNINENETLTVIKAIKENFSAKKRTFCWWFTDFVKPQKLKEILLQDGFQVGSAFLGMIFDLSQKLTIPKEIENIAIKAINEEQQLLEWIKPLQSVFGIDDHSGQFCVKMLKHYLSDYRFKHYYIEDNKRIVAVASLFIENKVSGFYNLAVLPEYRGRKYATALKWFRLKVSQDLGADFAILQSSTLGRKLDQSIGFKPVLDFVPYMCET